MCRRFLWLAVFFTLQLGLAFSARADTTNAAIPYKAMDELCQIASGADQTKLKVEVYVSSADKAVQSSNITLMIQSATQGKIPVTVGTNGQILNFPHRKELTRENPFIVANQPKGTLHLSLHYQIPLPEELTFRYARLGDGIAEANKMIKAQAGMMSLFAPKAQGALFIFSKESSEKASVTILTAAGRKEFVADKKGQIKLKLEKSLLSENPEVQLSEKPEVVLPDIE